MAGQLGNKERGFDLSWLAGVVYPTLFRTRKSLQLIGNRESAAWIHILHFWSSGPFTGTLNLSKFQFSDTAQQVAAAPSWT